MTSRITGHVVSHTHWDRAWYMTFEQTRVRLLDLMDDLLDLLDRDPGYRYFVLDGQMAMVLDYLSLRPERAGDIRRLASEGRLLLGPFFVLPDLFIPSGESLVRNLRVGIQAAKLLGPVMRLGYLPDPFGHPAQLPQVLRGFGIRGMVLTRGMGDEAERLGADFLWKGADGSSSVLVTHQIEGYGNLERLGQTDRAAGEPAAEAAVRTVVELSRHMAPYCPSGLLLLNNGCDHLPAQPELPELLRQINRRLPWIRLVHSTPVAYQLAVWRAIRAGKLKPGTFCGELRGGRYANLLPGVLSARVDLKLRHASCETLLLRWAEPFCALARALGVGRDDRALLGYAWRQLLLCQPHDDICGCSIDQVHDDDLSRMAHVEQVGSEVRERALLALAGHIALPGPDLSRGAPAGRHYLAVNPHPWPVTAAIALQGLPRGVLDGEKPLPVQQDRQGTMALTSLPPLGLLLLTARPGRDPALSADQVTVRQGTKSGGQKEVTLANGLVRVRVEKDGRLTVKDRRTGLTFRGLAGLLSEGDAGDTYDFSPPVRQSVTRSAGGRQARLRVLRAGPIVGLVEARLSLAVPDGLTRDRQARSRRCRQLPVLMRIRLVAGSPVVELELAVHNNARDHRLRMVFTTPLDADSLWVGAPFQILARPVEEPPRPGWHQPPYGIHPFADLVIVQDPGSRPAGGLALLAPGLREYEARRTRQGTEVLLTLLRSVGWLSRDDLSTRRGEAGPVLPVKGALQLGPHTFRLALLPFAGSWDKAGVIRRCQEHAAPPLALPLCSPRGAERVPPLAHRLSPPFPREPELCLPPRLSLLQVEPDTVSLAALLPGPGGTIEARLVNLRDTPVTARLHGPLLGRTALILRLDGTPQAGQVRLDHLPLGPAEILTLRLELDLRALCPPC